MRAEPKCKIASNQASLLLDLSHTLMSDDRERSMSDRGVLHSCRAFWNVWKLPKPNKTKNQVTFLVTNLGLRLVTPLLVSHPRVWVMTFYRDTLPKLWTSQKPCPLAYASLHIEASNIPKFRMLAVCEWDITCKSSQVHGSYIKSCVSDCVWKLAVWPFSMSSIGVCKKSFFFWGLSCCHVHMVFKLTCGGFLLHPTAYLHVSRHNSVTILARPKMVWQERRQELALKQLLPIFFTNFLVFQLVDNHRNHFSA